HGSGTPNNDRRTARIAGASALSIISLKSSASTTPLRFPAASIGSYRCDIIITLGCRVGSLGSSANGSSGYVHITIE
ncbi:MAG: hypothetical protein WC455_31185, partial [Dehalococcoidia bacterium]